MAIADDEDGGDENQSSSSDEGDGPFSANDSSPASSDCSAARPVDMLAGEFPPDPYPDNQLGLLSSSAASEAESEVLSDAGKGPREPEPEDPELKPLTHEEKMKGYWQKFVVPWPQPRKDEDSDASMGASSESASPRSQEKRHCSDAEHLSSDTMSLPGREEVGEGDGVVANQAEGSDKSSDSDSDSEGSGSDSDLCSLGSVVEEDAFHKAMEAGSCKAHKAAIGSSSSMSTLETPKCSKPEA